MLYLNRTEIFFFSFCWQLASLELYGENLIVESEEIWEIVLNPQPCVFKDP